MVEFVFLGNTYIIKFLRAKRFKKNFTLATPPPWYKDPSQLRVGQVAQVLRFSKVAHETRGMPLSERMKRIAQEASRPTGYARPKVYTPLPKVGKILSLAERYGIPIPPELRGAPALAPAPAPATIPRGGIRE